MSRRGKLLARIFAVPTPNDLTFDEVAATFVHFGGTVLAPSGGSHHDFRFGQGYLSVPRQNPLKPKYVRGIRDIMAAAGVRP